jgi:hypothetical protein
VLGYDFISFVRTKEMKQRKKRQERFFHVSPKGVKYMDVFHKTALQSLDPAFLRKKWECRELATLKQPAF